MTDLTPPNSPERQSVANGYTLTDAERAVIARHEARLVCSWCGEDFEGDPENMGSDCCSCDLVPASHLPGLLKDARREARELDELLAEREDDAPVLGRCSHGVDLDREFCPEGCRV